MQLREHSTCITSLFTKYLIFKVAQSMSNTERTEVIKRNPTDY